MSVLLFRVSLGGELKRLREVPAGQAWLANPRPSPDGRITSLSCSNLRDQCHHAREFLTAFRAVHGASDGYRIARDKMLAF